MKSTVDGRVVTFGTSKGLFREFEVKDDDEVTPLLVLLVFYNFGKLQEACGMWCCERKVLDFEWIHFSGMTDSSNYG